MTELKDLKPYKKDITWKGSKVRWCKIIDKNGVPLINFDISEDKADFIINCINNHDALLAAVESISKHEDERRKVNIGYDEAVDAIAKLAIKTVAAIAGTKE